MSQDTCILCILQGIIMMMVKWRMLVLMTFLLVGGHTPPSPTRTEHHHDNQQAHNLQHGPSEHEVFLKKLEAPAVRNGKHGCIVEWHSPSNRYAWNLCAVGLMEWCTSHNATETFYCFKFKFGVDLQCGNISAPAIATRTSRAGWTDVCVSCSVLGRMGDMDSPNGPGRAANCSEVLQRRPTFPHADPL
ncbi:unnamed protein product [Vitrella brassicaformis CCMP3155]|uniref:Uncharacterized protein n=1 Tax=Vitrella brassicaformis (strain CCMP3155) TaxID=1169540 RepID=A0A0G4H0K0_VITBC|nr:unnamed protein product [Vitrella brassicaformis CCMP3155]|eukprot:CEM36939.1 unnamed protein product [Vitrella brassicaformis CCMP3155]